MEKDKEEEERNLETVKHSREKERKKRTNIVFRKIDST